MATTTKAKKNPDYSASATITNPTVVADRLKDLAAWQIRRLEVEAKVPKDILEERAICDTEIKTVTEAIKALVQAEGSYQDVDAGIYAVKQLRQSWEYRTEPFAAALDGTPMANAAPLVIVRSVNVNVLQGLISQSRS